MEMDALLSRFRDVSDQPDGGYLACCPAHGDSRPSLRIWFGEDGRVRMTCRAGCPTGDVVTAAGLRWANMFNATGTASVVSANRPDLVGVAEVARLRVYLDAAADTYANSAVESPAETYAVGRFGIAGADAVRLSLGFDDGSLPGLPDRSSGFRRFPRLIVPLVGFDGVARGLQGRDVSGNCPARWMSLTNPEGLCWAAYGVLTASQPTDTYIVTEGPGDGLTAVSAGYNAVVIRGASLATSPELVAELAEGLKGKRVILAGDNDESGLRFNRLIADGLSAHGIPTLELRLPDLGPKTDLTDWRASNVPEFKVSLDAAVNAASVFGETMEPAEPAAPGIDNDAAPDADQIRAVQNLYYETLRDFDASDVQGAYLLTRFAAGTVKFAPGLGFHVWTGRVWERSDGKVRNMVHFIGRCLVAAARKKTEDKAPDQKEDPGEGLRKAAKGFTNRRRIDDLIHELQTVPEVAVDPSAVDHQPDLLAFRNGTVDLRTGLMRPHRKADLLTYCLHIDYVPFAECPRWEAFLTEIFPNMDDMPAYVQRLCGYGVTGHTSEQCFAVLWGSGANGKSVLTDTLTATFRGITSTTPFSTFEEKQGGGIPNDIAALRGARYVMASEGESGKPMSEAVLKRVTGKDEITARFLRQEFFTYKPSFLLMLATNFKPRFKGQDEGLWRRVKLIPFTRYFAPEERDYSLDQKLLAEAEGIAAWAVRGAMEWYRSGLQDPKQIQEATQEYRRTSDALAGFFPGVLEESDGGEMTAGDVYRAYKQWCEAEGLPDREHWNRRTLIDAMSERKVANRPTAQGVSLVGIRLRSDHPDVPAGPGIFA